MYFAITRPSPLGILTLERDGDSLVGLWLETRRPPVKGAPPSRPDKGEAPVFKRVQEWLAAYFAGEKPSTAGLALSPRGTPFQLEVWERLARVPYGQTVSYSDIARELAPTRPSGRLSARAVGGAVGSNPISIIIPCHRVVGADGSLVGFGGGLEAKRRLLEREGLRPGLEGRAALFW
ncbi:MAG: methylated-DNA--[protein]-cysteine S-methyltransferase [Deltaproteobacteria bacterium]|jgi:methylated-DNA-[protein]-cysteine S-methyltransferase|nr:methylated-DNA--[protein]-cysteine S-methyltransferase [Deltaproteobacteria bacterium]